MAISGPRDVSRFRLPVEHVSATVSLPLDALAIRLCHGPQKKLVIKLIRHSN